MKTSPRSKRLLSFDNHGRSLPYRVGLLLSVVLFIASVTVPLDLKAEESLPTAPFDKGLLLTRAQAFLARRVKLQPGESVLLIADRSADEVLRRVFSQAARNAGATVEEIVLQGHPEITDGFEIARKMRFQVWYPDWLQQPAAEVDVVLRMTNFGSGHLGVDFPLPAGTRMFEIPFARQEQLVDPMSRGNYPEQILVTLAKVLWKQMAGASRIQLNDVEGTDLRWTLDPTAWEEVKDFNPARNPAHISLPPPYRSGSPDMEGWLVGSSTHTGPLPQLRVRVQDGKAVEVEGGEHVGDYLRRIFAEYQAIQFPGFPGPGSNWIEETALGTHPGLKRVPGAETFGWWAEMRSWNVAARAGVVHLAIGSSRSGANSQFSRQRGLEIQHWDIELLSPTLVMDGRTIISRGHLTALDDPSVREIASQHGDPDQLLNVTSISSGD